MAVTAPAATPIPVVLHLTDEDLDAISRMMAAAGFTTVEQVVLCGLYHFGQHLQAGVPLTAFRGRKG